MILLLNFDTVLSMISVISVSLLIPNSVPRSGLFTPVVDPTRPVYLLIHQCVPAALSSLIRQYVRSKVSRHALMISFMTKFYDLITRPFWKLHSSLQHQWEVNHGITRRKKRFYRRRN